MMRSVPVEESRSYIGGVWLASSDRQTVRAETDQAPAIRVLLASASNVSDAVESSVEAGCAWARVPAFERAEILTAMAAGMLARSEDLAAQMVAESGKTIRDARTEVTRSLSTMQISAEEAKRITGEMVPMEAVPAGTGKLGFTLRVPVGVVAGITPFNAPLNTICHKLGPALAAGNTLVLKPHPNGAGVAVILGEIAREAGVPAGVFNVVHGGPEVGRALTTDRRVAFVNFTGSGRIAEQILSEIGLKRTLLELGGNAPTLVHSDADISKAAIQLAEAAFGLSGQSCISTQRVLVHSSVRDELVRRLIEEAENRQPGDPWDEQTRTGPMLDEVSANRVQSWVDEAVAQGATLLCGGHRDGCFVEPTILAETTPNMKVACEEIFGPVLVVKTYEDLDEAIEEANNTPWGLKAGVFTGSLNVAMRVATELAYGTVNINGASRSRLDQEPSGGVKLSGWGREGPRHAIKEMTDVRMISMAWA